MKATQSQFIAMSDMFRAIAGCEESQFDMIACTVYSAARSVMLSGNKTAFLKLESDCKLYGIDSKESNAAAKDIIGVKSLNAAVKKFKKTYFALSVALDQCGIPNMVKDLPQGKTAEIREQQDAILNPLADDYAQQFTAIFVNTMIIPEKTDAERAQALDERAVKKAAKDAASARELKQTIKTEAAKQATSSSGVRALIDALASGMLSASDESALIEAVRTRETAVLLSKVAQDSREPIEA